MSEETDRILKELQVQNAALESLVLDLVATLRVAAPADLAARLAKRGSKIRRGHAKPLGAEQERFRRMLIDADAAIRTGVSKPRTPKAIKAR